MVLSNPQHLLLAVSLALCLCFLVPKMIGGGGEGARKDPRRMPHPYGRSQKESPGKGHVHHGGSEKGFPNIHQVKGAVEQELKSEQTGSSRSMAFSIMPIYAVGVALFAAYKFTKIKSKENSKSKPSDEENKKSKETEIQLVELERHLSQTEQMLNSLLTQLDPLSSCVNTLAADQKHEIISQLLSIRQLMKKSAVDKSAPRNPGNKNCEDTLEHLIHSFESQPDEQGGEDLASESGDSVPDIDEMDTTAPYPVADKSPLPAHVDVCQKEEDAESDKSHMTGSALSQGLRKRNVKD
ncbi:coiled-coil domain-containing protein 107 [Hyperolius riggenbachi]|uniref:coiled-coil domain-containing protein 107 n=1 Tax=Hyperolius riggenbachi TaxID=752182 RepID=UPI0035A3C9C2